MSNLEIIKVNWNSEIHNRNRSIIFLAKDMADCRASFEEGFSSYTRPSNYQVSFVKYFDISSLYSQGLRHSDISNQYYNEYQDSAEECRVTRESNIAITDLCR